MVNVITLNQVRIEKLLQLAMKSYHEDMVRFAKSKRTKKDEQEFKARERLFFSVLVNARLAICAIEARENNK